MFNDIDWAGLAQNAGNALTSAGDAISQGAQDSFSFLSDIFASEDPNAGNLAGHPNIAASPGPMQGPSNIMSEMMAAPGTGARTDYIGTTMNQAGIPGRSHTQSVGGGSPDEVYAAGIGSGIGARAGDGGVDYGLAPTQAMASAGILGGGPKLGSQAPGPSKKKKKGYSGASGSTARSTSSAPVGRTAEAAEVVVPGLIGLTPRARDILSKGLR